MSTIIPVVVASAGEAELAALFANMQNPYHATIYAC
jgi:hypothetical protein